MIQPTDNPSAVVRRHVIDKVASPQRTNYEAPASTGKRKRSQDEFTPNVRNPPNNARQSKSKEAEEKRLKPFRKCAPQTFLQKLSRAQTQRMIVVGRRRTGSSNDICEKVDIVGSTGNIYEVTIARLPTCTCPDHRKGNECKHKVYALHTVLKAPDHLQYQRALLTSELDEIFAGAPPIPTDVGDAETHNGKRKPIDGECPICYMDLEEDDSELTWCKAACGNNMHKSCFEQWVASQRGKAARCVYCRAEWELGNTEMAKIRESGVVTSDGYMNVADHFGISRTRDYSTYHRPWVRQQFGLGL